MSDITIDVEKILPFIIKKFTEVYGNEYSDIISTRLKTATIFQYYNIEGLGSYIYNVLTLKERELSVKLLESIGENNLDLEKYKKDKYKFNFDNDVEEILRKYIGTSCYGFGEENNYWAPLKAFNPDNDSNQFKVFKNKLVLINYLLGDNHEEITADNFDSFTKTEEYANILKKVAELNAIYDPLLLEYKNFKSKMTQHIDFIDSEKKRKYEVLTKKKSELLQDIYQKLPPAVINAIKDKPLSDQIDIFMGYSFNIGGSSNIESFSQDAMESLKSESISQTKKFFIATQQAKYLTRLAPNIINKEIINPDSDEWIDGYLNFLNQDNVKKYIPSSDVIDYISSNRKKMYEEAIKEYYTTRQDFINIKTVFGEDLEKDLDDIYELIKNETICITSSNNYKDGTAPIMLYGVRDYGYLFYSFAHECGHIIDKISPYGSGFDKNGANVSKNPYDESYRKYEKFNETLNDIFTTEAVKSLQNQGIYLIEPKEYTLSDIDNCNTSLITRNILQPLLLSFRQQIIKAKVNSDSSILTSFIGEENFEELVDVVNKVDYLSRNGVVPKIDTSPDDEMVKDYYKQLERAQNIYLNIDSYYDANYSNYGADIIR